MTNKEAIRYLELIKGYLPDIQSYVPADYFIEKSLEALDHAIGVLKNSVPDVQVGENSAVILGNVNLPSNAAVGCGVRVEPGNIPVGPSAGLCFLEQSMDVVYGWRPYMIPLKEFMAGTIDPLYRKFERFSDD